MKHQVLHYTTENETTVSLVDFQFSGAKISLITHNS